MNFALTLFWLLIPVAASLTGIFFQPGPWYDSLLKPAWNPPSWLFPPVWSALYLAMGAAAALVWRTGPANRRGPLALFLVQLLFNAAWSWIFFGKHAMGWGVVDIAVLDVLVLPTMIAFRRVRPAAGILIAPYFAWVSFATFLTFTLWRLNR